MFTSFVPLPFFQSTLSGPRTVVLDRMAASAEGVVSCEASSFSRPTFQTKRGHILLTVVSLPSKTPPGSRLFLFWIGYSSGD